MRRIQFPLSDQKIHFVPKDENPPNVPQVRPIGNFGGIFKSKVYDSGWTAKTEHQLKLRIRNSLREFEWTVVQDMMSTINTKIQKTADTSSIMLL